MAEAIAPEKKRSLRALLATNFFLADAQTGLGPFLAAYLASTGWSLGRVGVAPTAGGIVTLPLQTPPGLIVEPVRSRRALVVAACAVNGCRSWASARCRSARCSAR